LEATVRLTRNLLILKKRGDGLRHSLLRSKKFILVQKLLGGEGSELFFNRASEGSFEAVEDFNRDLTLYSELVVYVFLGGLVANLDSVGDRARRIHEPLRTVHYLQLRFESGDTVPESLGNVGGGLYGDPCPNQALTTLRIWNLLDPGACAMAN
jgi:hypothetical protein